MDRDIFSSNASLAFIVLYNEHSVQRYHLFNSLTDQEALSHRLVSKWFYANLNEYREARIQAAEKWLKQSSDLHNSQNNVYDSTIVSSKVYGPSGNYAYLCIKNTDTEKMWLSRIRCPINQDGTFDRIMEKKIAGDVVLWANTCELKFIKQIPLFMMDCLFISYQNLKHTTLFVNTPTSACTILKMPLGSDIDVRYGPSSIVVHGFAKTEYALPDLLWKATLFHNLKKELTLKTLTIENRREPLALLKLLSPESLKTRFVEKKHYRDCPEYNQSFDTVFLSNTIVTSLIPQDKLLLDTIHYASLEIPKLFMCSTPSELIARYCVMLKRLSLPKELHTIQDMFCDWKDDLYKKLIFSLIYRMKVKKSVNSSMYVTMIGFLDVPTTKDRESSVNSFADLYFKKEGRCAFQGENCDTQCEQFSVDEDQFFKSVENQSLDEVTFALQDWIQEKTDALATYTWDNGLIGTTWSFDESGMRVVLYDFNADNFHVGTYYLHQVKSGHITQVLYNPGEQPRFFVDGNECGI